MYSSTPPDRKMVKIVSSLSEFSKEISSPGLVVVDFFADWCGPCRNIAPFYEQLSLKYPNVTFLKVNVDNSQDIAASCQVSAMPTFKFFIKGKLVDELKGANPNSLEEKVLKHRVDVSPFGGAGFRLSSADQLAQSPAQLREARLRALESTSSSSFGHPPAPTVPVSQLDADADADLSVALALSMQDSNPVPVPPSTPISIPASSADPAPPTPTDPAMSEEEFVPVPVDPSLLSQLTAMGFLEVRARKAIVHGQSLEGALGWLEAHEGDEDIDQPYLVRKSESEARKPLTEEERRRKVEELQQKAKERRMQREAQEKAEEFKREKERRERGQKMETFAEERDRLLRKHEAEKAKREKEAEIRERERIRAEIARDKEIRRTHGGVIPSVLGVEGYNPSIPQYESNLSSSSKQTVQTLSPSQKIDKSIEAILRYRTGGSGGAALSLLLTFVRNVVNNPSDSKFRSINTESNAFKSKFGGLVGPTELLRALGFEKDSENKLKLSTVDGPLPSEQYDLFVLTSEKLAAAENTFRQMNPS